MPAISAAALCELSSRVWPGNVRELRNAIEHAAIMSRGSTIEVVHLPPATDASGRSADPLHREIARWTLDKLQSLDRAESAADLYEDFLKAVEPPLLQVVLERCRNNRAAAARLLGLHRATLRQKLKSHDINPQDDDSTS